MTNVKFDQIKHLQQGSRSAMLKTRKKAILNKMIAKGTMTRAVGRRIVGQSEPGMENTGTLFYFKKKYYYVAAGKLEKPSEGEIDNLLEPNHRIKLYLICSDTVCPLPKPFDLEPDVEAHKVKDDQEACRFMTSKSGIMITVKDL